MTHDGGNERPTQAHRGLSAVVSEGDYRQSLTALRDKLAAEVELAGPRELAPLAKQLAEVLARIDSLPAPAEVRDAVDDIAAARAARRSAS